jgi:glycosyltransferase involved in cell wall biosynthesis
VSGGSGGPLAVVTNWASAYRVGLYELLARERGAEFLFFGGRTGHPQDLAEQLAGLEAPAEALPQRHIYGRITGGGYRAVVGSTNGRIALPSAYLAARRRNVPFLLWATIWRHPRTLPHALTWPPMRWIYSHADAVITDGPHVSRYVSRFRDPRTVFVGVQAMDNERYASPIPEAEVRAVRDRTGGRPFLLFVGRLIEAKGVRVLAEAWRRLSGDPELGEALLVVAGDGPLSPLVEKLPRTLALGRVPYWDLRPWYAEARALAVPSLPTRDWLEPWGYVANEAMLQGTPVIASDAVGAAAGGLVVDAESGIVVPAGDSERLAGAAARLLADPQLASSLGVRAREMVSAYTHPEQARGFELALESCGVG